MTAPMFKHFLPQRLQPTPVVAGSAATLSGCVLWQREGDEAEPAAPASDDAQPTHPSTVGSNGMQGLHAGYVLAASVLIGLGIGYGIDLWLDSLPWGMVGGALFFIIAGLYQVVKEFQR